MQIAGQEPDGRTLRLNGEQCVALRKRKGLSREGLAGTSHGVHVLSVATIKRAEKGCSVYPGSAVALANLLQVPIEQLLRDGGLRTSLPAAPSSVPEQARTQVAIAVLPFECLGGDPNAQVFADGLVEDLITHLGGSWFPVIARSSSFSFRGEPTASREIGRRLGAGYLVEGSIRRDGALVRLTARLVESETGRQIWAGIYDAAYREAFALQDRLCAELVGAVGGQVLQAEEYRALRIGSGVLDGWELALRGAWHFHRRSAQDNAAARSYFLQALARDPLLPLAHYYLVRSLQHDILNQWSSDAAVTRAAMRRHAQDFERAMPGHPRMHLATAYACIAFGERDEATARLEEALHAEPNSAPAHSLYGQVLAMQGEADPGIRELDIAIRLSPRDPDLWTMLVCKGLAHFAAGRYEQAVSWAEKATRARPQIPFCHGAVAASYAHLGDFSAARRSLDRMRELQSHVSHADLQLLLASTNPEIAERYIAGLKRAGLPAADG
jgi:TolB-like protein/Tfp pilus assembly protein PilF